MSIYWQNGPPKETIDWLLNSNAWTRYRTLTDLLRLPKSDNEVKQAKRDLMEHEFIRSLLTDLKVWFPASITRHDSAVLPHYKLMMLADFGLTVNDTGVQDILNQIMVHLDDDRFAIRQTLPEKGQGFSKPDPNANEWHALPCDSPLLTYLLMKMGMADDPKVSKAMQKTIQAWDTPQGWFCHFFFVEGHFKKHQIGCPMAGLMALQLFSATDTDPQVIDNAFAALQFHKELGKSIYYFGRGKKFFTLKYPFVWYNALYLADVLTRFKAYTNTELVRELIDWLCDSADEQGRFTPTSMFMAYKGLDFANKKQPSPWTTYLVYRILQQYRENQP